MMPSSEEFMKENPRDTDRVKMKTKKAAKEKESTTIYSGEKQSFAFWFLRLMQK